ncbi:hypothetical protein AVEN_121496-1 [Araneus ventricosus]|uniref:Uncharacterized protein n=1 Tax=Araneus ventricosus TaxID=182803 RepID=A0A4Y2UFT3_ARAVE|nr:hypothetical protein AVEN_128936-1 [Araneus ventricosus]GBO11444.1 hypothetical protein AVEN_121496-1 [Araneus ventricosus]
MYENNRKLKKFSAHSTNVLCAYPGSHDTGPDDSRTHSTQFLASSCKWSSVINAAWIRCGSFLNWLMISGISTSNRPFGNPHWNIHARRYLKDELPQF